MSSHPQAKPAAARTKPVTITTLQKMRADNDKISMLTCYDASFAALMEQSGVDSLLIGDSLGMTCQGHSSTLPVTVEDMVYHTASVARGNQTMLLITDMPFGSYPTPEVAFTHAAKLMQAGAHMVKVEGGTWVAETIRFLVERSIPVCAHIGLTPQSVHQMGGFKVQGKTTEAATRLIEDALAVQAAGASLVVIEGVPAALGKEVTQRLDIPTIGIGAGPDCSGQVLVMHDLLGVFPGHKAKFVRNFMEGSGSIQDAVTRYVSAVKDGSFPAPEHCF